MSSLRNAALIRCHRSRIDVRNESANSLPEQRSIPFDVANELQHVQEMLLVADVVIRSGAIRRDPSPDPLEARRFCGIVVGAEKGKLTIAFADYFGVDKGTIKNDLNHMQAKLGPDWANRVVHC